jgi:hypothetical protein
VVKVSGEVWGVGEEFDPVGDRDHGNGDEGQSEEAKTDYLVECGLGQRIEEADHRRSSDTHRKGAPGGVKGGEAGV